MMPHITRCADLLGQDELTQAEHDELVKYQTQLHESFNELSRVLFFASKDLKACKVNIKKTDAGMNPQKLQEPQETFNPKSRESAQG